MQLRLQPSAADVQKEMRSSNRELGLILVLAGGIILHHWQKLLSWLPLAPASLQEGPLMPGLNLDVLALALGPIARTTSTDGNVASWHGLADRLAPLVRQSPRAGVLSDPGDCNRLGWRRGLDRTARDPKVLGMAELQHGAVVYQLRRMLAGDLLML